MSEGRLVYPVAQKVGNEVTTKTIEKEGPVAFLVTTTKRKLHPENETRMLSLEIDDSEAQTRAVLAKIAQIEGINAADCKVDFMPWHDFQRWLEAGECRVVVPYAGELATLVPPRSVRLRRDLGQVLRAIKAHALLHRKHRDRDSHGQIVADIGSDYAAIRDLMHDLLAETSDAKIPDTVLETIDAVKALTASVDADDGTTTKAVAGQLKLDKSAAYRRLRTAEDSGFVINLETRKGRPGRYRVTGDTVEEVQMLPTVDVLKTAVTGNSVAITQPCTRPSNDIENQSVNGCSGEYNLPCNRPTPRLVANGNATAAASPEHPGKLQKTGERLHDCTIATTAEEICQHCFRPIGKDPSPIPVTISGTERLVHNGCYELYAALELPSDLVRGGTDC
jgi:hypothetical protein